VNDSDVVVITDEKVFTFQNTSEEQMSRVSLQSYLTLSLSVRLIERAKAEVILLQSSLSLILASAKTFEQLLACHRDILERRSEFKIANSMGTIVEKVCEGARERCHRRLSENCTMNLKIMVYLKRI
jgi:hypothetical protein